MLVGATTPKSEAAHHWIGVSIPRSGHHYLARLVQDVLGDGLRYCEFYTPLDCCHQMPCGRRGAARVIFQKNHDFDLTLDAGRSDCLYVVQTRAPLLEAMSDRELAEAVRPELRGDVDELAIWLGKKAVYYEGFHRKWMAVGAANAIHISYETLMQDPAGVLQALFTRAGLCVDPEAIATAVARQAGRRDDTRLGPFAPRVPKDDIAPRPYFEAFAALLADPGDAPGAVDDKAAEAVQLAATAHRETMAKRPSAAAAVWRTFGRKFPGNAYGNVELSQCLQALGEPGEALHCALEAARLQPVRWAAVKQARDLLMQQGRHAESLGLSRELARQFPERPLGLIDLTVDLLHAGRAAEATVAARRFLEVAAAAPIEQGQTCKVWALRCVAYGFNEAFFWEAACHVLMAGGDARRGLEAAHIAQSMSGATGPADLVRQAERALAEESRGGGRSL